MTSTLVRTPRSLSQLHQESGFDKHIVTLVIAFIAPGVALTFLFLGASAFAACMTVSRRFLNRVSFRLLVYALTANFIFGIMFLLGAAWKGPSPRCSFIAFLVNFSLMISAGLFFCMALNLVLVLVYKVNGQRMEKYYIFGTFLLCVVCNGTPYAAGRFGWNEANLTCWFKLSADASENEQLQMLHWLIGTQSSWVLLMATGETVAFSVVFGYIWLYARTTRNLRADTDTSFASPPLPQSPIAMYRGMIIRIGLYPLLSCLMNFSTTILDLYQVKNPIITELNWRLGIADLAIYSVRPLFYCLLAMTDPSFIRAVSALRRARLKVDTRAALPGSGEGVMSTTHWMVHTVPMRVHIELGEYESQVDTQHTRTSITPGTGKRKQGEEVERGGVDGDGDGDGEAAEQRRSGGGVLRTTLIEMELEEDEHELGKQI